MRLDFLNITNEILIYGTKIMTVAYVVLSIYFVQNFPGFHIQGQKSKKSA